MVDLTEGAIVRITGGATSPDLRPILQVTELKQLQTKRRQDVDQFRLVLSDGCHLQQATLGTQLNHLVRDGNLRAGSVVQLIHYTCITIQNRVIVVIVDLAVVVKECGLIGFPLSLQKPSGPSPAAPTEYSMNGDSYPQLSDGVAAYEQHPQVNEPNNGSEFMSYDSGRNVGASSVGSSPSGMPYFDQAVEFHNPRQEDTSPLESYLGISETAYQQPPTSYGNIVPFARNEAPATITPVGALNLHEDRWTIKARVTVKAEMRHYTNNRGKGKVFSFDLLGADGGEIRATCFNTVADQFYSQIEVGRVYLISKGSLKAAQKNYNHLSHDLEIFLESGSTVQHCHEDDNSIPRQQFCFRQIIEVETMENNSVVDVIGVVSSITPATSVKRKDGSETNKRNLQLKDMSGRSVELTLWGNLCNEEGQVLQNMCDSGDFPVLAVKSGRISDYNGKKMGTISTSQLFIDPDFPVACSLKQWFDQEGRNTHSISISKEFSSVGRNDPLKTISRIKEERLGTSGKPDWVSVNAAVTFIRADNFFYTSCPIMIGNRRCSKKVTNDDDGKWWCEKCEQSVDECDFKYVLQVQIQDHTDATWVTVFQECAEELLGISAKDLYIMKFEKQDDEGCMKILSRVLFTRYVFKLRVQEEKFNGEERVKATAVKAEKANFGSRSRALLGLMEKFKDGIFTSSMAPRV
ncbi:Replication protein A 70 kDa DNA-binding subunit C [Linum grandiflorum]